MSPDAKRIRRVDTLQSRVHTLPVLETKSQLIQRLVIGIQDELKGGYERRLTPFDHRCLIVAESFVGQLLGKEADPYHRVHAVIAFASVPSARYTPRLKDLVKEFSQGVSCGLIPSVIQAFGKQESKDLEDFAKATIFLSTDMDADERATNLANLAEFPLQYLTPAFGEVIEHLTKGMNRSAKGDVICAFGNIPPQHLERIAAMAEGLSAGMDSSDKLSVVCAANSIPFGECVDFEAMFNFLTKGLALSKKAECFREFAYVYDLCREFWEDHKLDPMRSVTLLTFVHPQFESKRKEFLQQVRQMSDSDEMAREIEQWVAIYALSPAISISLLWGR